MIFLFYLLVIIVSCRPVADLLLFSVKEKKKCSKNFM